MLRSFAILLTVVLGLTLTAPTMAQTGASCGPLDVMECQTDCDNGVVFINWIPQGDYEGFEILRNGQPIGFVPGFQNNFQDFPPGPGLYDYVVQPFCLFGPPPPPSFCLVDFCPVPPQPDLQFVRGDVNSDGGVNLGDWIAVLDLLFNGGVADCMSAYDVNDDGAVNLGDAIYGLTYQFGGGVQIPLPFPGCGNDPTPDGLTCDFPTSCGFPLPPLQPLPLDLAPLALDQLQSFAIQRYDDLTGQPLPLQWIEDPILVQLFQDSIDLGSVQAGSLMHDATAHTELLTFGGQRYQIGLAEIELGLPGQIIFDGGWGTCSELMQEAIGLAYGDPTYGSLKEKAKETTCTGETPSASCDWEEEELIDEVVGVWVWTDITLIVYQDNDNDDTTEEYAGNLANGQANTETFEANGKNSIVNKLRQLQGQCKRVKKIIFVCHGSPGSFRIGPQGTPFRSGTRVGLHEGQTSPTDFGESIAPYLTDDATITILGCSSAADGGTDETDGQEMIQDLADASGADVTAYDQAVDINGANDQASSQGAGYTATPGGDAPTQTTAAPAGNINP